MPGVEARTPHAMTLEVVLESTEVLVNVGENTEIRLFAPRKIPTMVKARFTLRLRALPLTVQGQ